MNLLSLSESLINKKISPRELVKESLKRIKHENPTYNSFITVCEEKALADASTAEEELRKGLVKGPIHGVPFALKDVIFY